jgi:hypothetical protein
VFLATAGFNERYHSILQHISFSIFRPSFTIFVRLFFLDSSDLGILGTVAGDTYETVGYSEQHTYNYLERMNNV